MQKGFDELPQQGWFVPPHVPHPPKTTSEHLLVSGEEQVAPPATQTSLTQHAPTVQPWSSQQRWPT